MKKLYLSLLAVLLTPTIVLAEGEPKRIESQSNIFSLQDVVTAIIKNLYIFLPAVATLYLIFSGYRYMIAQGNPDLVEKAKKSLTYAVFGVIVSYSAAALILVFARALNFNPGF